MATRRIISSEKPVLEKDDTTDFSPPAGEKSNITPAVPVYVSHWLIHYLTVRIHVTNIL